MFCLMNVLPMHVISAKFSRGVTMLYAVLSLGARFTEIVEVCILELSRFHLRKRMIPELGT